MAPLSNNSKIWPTGGFTLSIAPLLLLLYLLFAFLFRDRVLKGRTQTQDIFSQPHGFHSKLTESDLVSHLDSLQGLWTSTVNTSLNLSTCTVRICSEPCVPESRDIRQDRPKDCEEVAFITTNGRVEGELVNNSSNQPDGMMQSGVPYKN
jgi:hypothetical protein